MPDLLPLVWVLLAVLIVIGAAGLVARVQRTTVYDYQRGLRYRNGRFVDVLGPGAYWSFRPTTTIRVVDMRSSVLPLPGQELVTSDAVTVKASLAVTRRIVDPAVAVNQVENVTASV